MSETTLPELRHFDPADTGWTDYVLSLMTKDEVQDGRPKCVGLRRVTELLMGKIVESHARVVQSPVGNMVKTSGEGEPLEIEYSGNGGRCVIEHTIAIMDHEGVIVRYTDCADGTPLNVKYPFNMFMVPVTGTRAEARTLTKILKLKTISYEEIHEDIQKELGGHKTPSKPVGCSVAQKGVINNLAEKLKIDILKLIELTLNKKMPLDALTVEQASNMIKFLNEVQQGKKKPPQEVYLNG